MSKQGKKAPLKEEAKAPIENASAIQRLKLKALNAT